ncbi:MAG: tRNA (adenosine(37)-N6)-threonylcarbamoyltransferase complex ATPase subunit type 1 TsaE [Sphingomonadaceae bacterium]
MILPTPETTHAAGGLLAGHIRVGDVIALSGELGAGKTSFARGMLAALGLAGDAPSPSYALVIPYGLSDVRIPLCHIDLYRLENPDDIAELGLDEARVDAALIIEWPERMGARLWPDALKIHLVPDERGGRVLTVDVPPSWEGRCPLS